MKKSTFIAFLILVITHSAHSQFYYRDLISNKQLLQEMSTYRENKVRTVTIKSIEPDGSESEGFFCERKISRDYRKTDLFTRSDLSGASLFTSHFDNTGKLIQTRDSSSISLTVNNYSYDANGRIRSISSTSKSSDDDFVTEMHEEHIYTYNDKEVPESMMRVKNKYDSIQILFFIDEKNNVAIEKDTKSGRKYYYYYDQQNRLTDIVHSNEFKETLLPDYMFEYNNAGQLTQMTFTEEGGSNYFVWKYNYNDGLRIREKCYSKERRLIGSIEYEYK